MIPRARFKLEPWHSCYRYTLRFHGSAWDGSIWECLERFHLGLLIVSNWVCFRIRSQLELYSWKWVKRFQMGPDRRWTKLDAKWLAHFFSSIAFFSSKWVRIGGEKSSKKGDWLTSSALLLFSYTPARQMSLTQFSSISSKWNQSRGNAMPIRTKLLRFQMKQSRRNAASNLLRKGILRTIPSHSVLWHWYTYRVRIYWATRLIYYVQEYPSIENEASRYSTVSRRWKYASLNRIHVFL